MREPFPFPRTAPCHLGSPSALCCLLSGSCAGAPFLSGRVHGSSLVLQVVFGSSSLDVFHLIVPNDFLFSCSVWVVLFLSSWWPGGADVEGGDVEPRSCFFLLLLLIPFNVGDVLRLDSSMSGLPSMGSDFRLPTVPGTGTRPRASPNVPLQRPTLSYPSALCRNPCRGIPQAHPPP